MSTTTQTQRPLNGTSVNAIMRKRSTLSVAMVGKKVVFTIQGNGNVIDVVDKKGEPVLSTIAGQEGIILQKKIFNLKTTSQLALSNDRTRGYLKEGIAAEKAGDIDAANEAYNAFLNSTQVSFGVLLPSAIADKLANGVDIAATVIRVDTENGSLLTIDPSTIMVKEPEVLAPGTAFDVASFFGGDASAPSIDDLTKKFAAMNRDELKAYAAANPDLGVVIKQAMKDDAIRLALVAAETVEA